MPVSPMRQERQFLAEAVRKSVQGLVETIRGSDTRGAQSGLADGSQRLLDVLGPGGLRRVIQGYRDLHMLFGAGPDSPEWAVHAEHALCEALGALGVRLRYADRLATVAGVHGASKYSCGTTQEGAALLTEVYHLAPDCIMMSPEGVGVRCRVGGEDLSLELSGALEACAHASVLSSYLPASLKLAPMPSGDGALRHVGLPEPVAGSAMATAVSVYDVVLLKRGAGASGPLDVWSPGRSVDALPAARVEFLRVNAVPGVMPMTAGAKTRDAGASMPPVRGLISVPFEVMPLDGSGSTGPRSPGASVVPGQAQQRCYSGPIIGQTTGAKRASGTPGPGPSSLDPMGYPMDGEFPVDRIVTGIVLEPEKPDFAREPIGKADGELLVASGDILSAEQVKLAMYWWMANTRGRMTFIHTVHGGKEIQEECPVLSCWTVGARGEMWNGREVVPGTWLLSVWCRPDWIWEDIQAKKIRAFSIGYFGYYHTESRSGALGGD